MTPARGWASDDGADARAPNGATSALQDDPPPGLRTNGETFRLPEGARTLSKAPVCRPVPGAPARLRGLAMIGGRCAPVWALVPAPQAWLVIDLPDGPVVLGGDALAEPAPAAPILSVPIITASPMPAAALRTPSPSPDTDAEGNPQPTAGPHLRRHGPARPATYVLRHGRHAVILPVAALDAILDMPQAPVVRQLGALHGALGHAELGGRAVLLLDPAWCIGQPVAIDQPGMVAVFRQKNRSLAMPIEQASPGTEGEDLLARLTGTPDGRALLAAAPTAGAPPPAIRAEPTRSLLLCEAGGTRFAIDVAEVTNVLAPAVPMPAPRGGLRGLRGVVSHRGEVLSVMDMDARLARSMSDRALTLAPLLRLLLPWPVAVPVERVLGLHAVPVRLVAPIEDDPLVSGLALLEGHTVPVCRAAALAAAASLDAT